jgi:hypothetical protein
MSRAIIRAWMDVEGRVWMETGQKQPKTGEMIIELLNGQASGSVTWVNSQFGPLERLGVQREPKDDRPDP